MDDLSLNQPKESLTTPSMNPRTWFWLLLLGLPAVLLFLIFEKQQDYRLQRESAPVPPVSLTAPAKQL